MLTVPEEGGAAVRGEIPFSAIGAYTGPGEGTQQSAVGPPPLHGVQPMHTGKDDRPGEQEEPPGVSAHQQLPCR